MFKNFNGVRARFHNSTIDELVHLNTEVYNGAVREKDLNLDYHIYPGGHSYSHAEFKDAFQYVIESFKTHYLIQHAGTMQTCIRILKHGDTRSPALSMNPVILN